MEIKELIYNKRIEAGLTMKQLADIVGVSEGTISRWESGDIANMRRDKITALAKALNISPATIMGWDEKEDEESATIKIPVYGRVAAGEPIHVEENIIGWEEIPKLWPGEHAALRIKGDSMSPRILDGDTIIVRKQDDAESGDVVVAMVNGEEATCKKLIKQMDGITLQPFNPAYEPKYFSREDRDKIPVVIWGKVIENRSRF